MDYSMNKVAKYLRLLGYDTVCSRAAPQDTLLRIAAAEGRILITCSNALAEKVATHNRLVHRRRSLAQPRTRHVSAYNSDGDSVYSSDSEVEEVNVPCITITQWRHLNFRQTIMEVFRRTRVTYDKKMVFSRCVTCNDSLVPVDKGTIEDRVEPNVHRMYREFTQCPSCLKVFWGFDGEQAINYKSFRTLRLLRSLCIGAGIDMEEARVNLSSLDSFRSFPRRVKATVFSYLDDVGLDAIAAVVPALGELVDEVRVCNREGREPLLFRAVRSNKKL